jgi:very-short-patch-repair endonuclease
LYGPWGTRHRGNDLLAGLSQVLPSDAAFAHVSGAALRGWPLPWLPEGLPVIAATQGPVHVQREGVYVRRLVTLRGEAYRGLPVLTTTELLCDLARDFQLVDLVPVVDAALRADGLQPADVRAQLRPRSKGRPRLLEALALADPRSESYWESVLRLVHVLGGITQIEPQVWIADGSVRGDLWLVGTRRIVEYDGGEHLLKRRHQRDIHRDKVVLRADWERYPYVSKEIIQTPGRILRDAEEALGLPHDPRRLAQWLQHARRSTLTGQGRAMLERRLDRYLHASARPDRPRMH